MSLGILAFGHGGGVPGPIPDTPVGNHGNTNFALIPGVTYEELNNLLLRYGPDEAGKRRVAQAVLQIHPFYLIDCGPETALRLCGVFGDLPVAHNLKGILLTHTHDDHSGGIKSLAYRTKFIEGTKPMLVYPAELVGILSGQMAEFHYLNPTVPQDQHGIDFFFGTNPLVLDNVFNTNGFNAQAFPVDHNCYDGNGRPFPAFGYHVITPSGNTVTFSGDTAFPLDTEVFANSDLVIHDVQFYADKIGNGQQSYVHCPYAMLKDAVPPTHRHKVWLTHNGHELPPEVKADGFAGLFRGGMLKLFE